MWPTFYEVESASGTFGLHSYGLLILLAFSAAFLLVHDRAHKVGFHPDRLLPVYMAAAVGVIGARLLYLIAVAKIIFTGAIFAGGVGITAVSLAAIAIWLCDNLTRFWKFCRRRTCPSARTRNRSTWLFFSGCCHGAAAPVDRERTALLADGVLHGQIWLERAFPFVTLEFHEGVGRLLNQPLYPTQLWSAAIGIGIALTLNALWSKRSFDGQLAAISLIVEPIGRIIVEVFRADHRGYAIRWPAPDWLAQVLPGMTRAGGALDEATMMGLTTSQAIGLGMALCGVSILIGRRGTGIAAEIPIDDDY